MSNISVREGHEILSEFDASRHLYEGFGVKLKALVEDLLTAAAVPFHSVSFRCKDRKSLERKLYKPGARYASLNQITDLCGLRVITYFEDDVRKVSDIFESEFIIDSENSVDKARALDPDRFGYLSVHYVVSNAANRATLSEYKKFQGLKAEIQVRSILQHAWAEIEHDLGYKTSNAIPREVRRQFSRLAGLLELADEEFNTIRGYLKDYSSTVKGKIESSPAEVELNAASLKAIVEGSKEIIDINRAISRAGRRGLENEMDIEDAGREVDRLRFFGINTAEKLMKAVREHGKMVERFAQVWLHDRLSPEDDEFQSFSVAIGVFYLAYILAVSDPRQNTLDRYLDEFHIGGGEESPAMIARDVRATYALAK
ncbi:hypothetical protein FUT88_02255 [Ralstonia sp. TCR112]|uniref:GTP pyrophosphokinase n=1 Tax=Ralstonia sp. TCR112 TaxID=2601730 RepID=UPI0011BD4BF6|nr:hypothetical protein [Ralstonia sp. TCR112]TXD63490.1 hypothetical protein FUT88_02255 [Ralstonia sp. TCR112]